MKNIKAKLLGLIAVVAVVFSVFAVSTFAGTSTEVADAAGLVQALAEKKDSIKLTADVTTDAPLTFAADTYIDLNGKTLTLGEGNNVFAKGADVTITNGTVNIDGVDADTDNAPDFECVLDLTAADVNLTLKDMTFAGKDFESNYGVFYIGASSSLVVDNTDITLDNDKSVRQGGVFKAGSASALVLIKNGSNVQIDDVQRGFTYVRTQIFDSTVTITGTPETLEHGMNSSTEITINNSKVTISGGKGRGITLGRNAATTLTITDSSLVSVSDMLEGTVVVQKANCGIILEKDSSLVMDARVSYKTADLEAATNVKPVDGSHIIIARFTAQDNEYTNVDDIAPNSGVGVVFDGDNGSYVYFETFIEDVNHHKSAVKSVYVELYSGDLLLATSTLNDVTDVEGTLLGTKVCITNKSSSWTTVSHVPHYVFNQAPTKAVLYVNGAAAAVCNTIEYMGDEDLVDPTKTWGDITGVVADADAWMDGKFYPTVADALQAANSATLVGEEFVIYVLRDATLPYTARTAYGDNDTKSITFKGYDVHKNGAAVTLTLAQETDSYYWATIDMANPNGEFLYDNINVVDTGAGNYVAKIDTAAQTTGFVTAEDFVDAFAYLQKGDTVTLLQNVTLTEGIKITNTDVLSNVTINGNNKLLTAHFTNKNAEGEYTDSVLYFGDVTAKAWATGVTVKNLSIDGCGRFAIALMGSGAATANIENVSVTGEWLYGVNLYGTMGANVTLSNFVSLFTNGSDNNALVLDSTTVKTLYANQSGDPADYFKVQVADTADYYWPTKIENLLVFGGNTKMINPTALTYAAYVADAKTGETMVAVDDLGIKYTKVQAAIDADEGDTVTLLCDVVENIAAYKVVLELNENTVEGYVDLIDATVQNGLIIYDATNNPTAANEAATIADGKVNYINVGIVALNDTVGVWVMEGSTVNFKDAGVLSKDNWFAIYVDSDATLNLTNSAISTTLAGIALQNNAQATIDADSSITVSGDKDAVAVYFGGTNAKATIDGDVDVTAADTYYAYAVCFGNLANSVAINGDVECNGEVINGFAQGYTSVTSLNKAVADRLMDENYDVEKNGRVYYVVANLDGKVGYYFDRYDNKVYLEDLTAATLKSLKGNINDDDDVPTIIYVLDTTAIVNFDGAIANHGEYVYDLLGQEWKVPASFGVANKVSVMFQNGSISGAQFNLNAGSTLVFGKDIYVSNTITVYDGATLYVAEGATLNTAPTVSGEAVIAGAVNGAKVEKTGELYVAGNAYVYGNIDAKTDANVYVAGGTIGNLNFNNNANLLMTDGSIETLTLSASNATAVIVDGYIGKMLVTGKNASAQIYGGTIDELRAFGKGDVTVYDGYFGNDVTALCYDPYCTVYDADLGCFVVTDIPQARYYGSSMYLDSGFALNFWFTADTIVDDNYFAVAIIKHEDTCNDLTEYVLIPYSEFVTREGSDLIGVSVKGIAAKDMICEVEVKLYRGELPTFVEEPEDVLAIEDNAVAVATATPVVDSIELYATAYLATYYLDGVGEAGMAKLLSDMLHYGAAAQRFFGHNVAHYADHRLVEVPVVDYGTVPPVDLTGVNAFNASGNYYGSSLGLEDTITINAFFAVDPATLANLSATVTYTDYLGETVTVEYGTQDMVFGVDNKGVTYAVVMIDTIAPADGYTVVNCTLKEGNKVVGTYTDSVLSLVAYALTTEQAVNEPAYKALLEKIANFTVSAKEYFAD